MTKAGSMEFPQDGKDLPWINPVGGLGDTLMLSGVLKLVADTNPTSRFNCVVRTKYPPLLNGHPVIIRIGHPPPSAQLMPTDYWHDPAFGQPGERAFQILASMFGLRRPVDEKLWVPWSLDQNDPVLHACLPWKKKNILLCPTSESPRKQMAFERWEAIVDRLRCDDFLVVQLGRRNDPHVRGTYSLLGLTTTRQAITLMRRFDLVLGVDNFLMHAAHLCEVPAVILWGPTDHRVYGYAGHVHMQAPACANLKDCIAPHNSHVYATECPKGPAHCMDQLALDSIYQAAREVLTGSRCSAPSPPPG